MTSTYQARTTAGSFLPTSDAMPRRSGPVIVAAGGEGNVSVLRAGGLVAQALGRDVILVSALEPSQAPVLPPPDAPTSSFLPDWVARDRRWRVEHDLFGRGERPEWPVTVEEGPAPFVLAREARRSHAALLVVGLGRQRPVDRLIGAETAVRTVGRVDCAVLAVPGTFTRLPHTVVVGVDFGEQCVRSVTRMLPLLEPGAVIHLVHVWMPDGHADAESVSRDERHRLHVQARLRALAGALQLPAGVTVETEIGEGRPAERLLDVAEAHHADLIAVGRHGRGMLERLLVGSVATRILRGATCAVFVAPESGATSSTADPDSGRERVELPRASWAHALDEFTRRHAGRLSRLDAVDEDGVPYSREQGYPFFGIGYRADEDVIEILLGEANGRRRHLSRAIPGATAVAMLRDADGVDEAVVVAHGRGETTLAILPRVAPGAVHVGDGAAGH